MTRKSLRCQASMATTFVASQFSVGFEKNEEEKITKYVN